MEGGGSALHREERRGDLRAGAVLEETLSGHHAAQVLASALVCRTSGTHTAFNRIQIYPLGRQTTG